MQTMDRPVIHIGLHKTASTYLQEIVWPKFKSYTFLTRPYTQHNYAFNRLQYADDSLYDKSSIIKELREIEVNNLLISDESLSGKPIYFSYLNRSLIAKRLNELFPQAIIILFIRDQKDIILSHYNSYIKSPFGIKRIEELFWKPKRKFEYKDYLYSPKKYDMSTLYYNTNDYYIHFDCFLYSKLIDLYTSLFENVEVFLYEDFVKNPCRVIQRLEKIMGHKIHINSKLFNYRINNSLNYSELEKQRLRNKYYQLYPNSFLMKGVGQLIKIYERLSPSKNLEQNVYNITKDYYSIDNKLVKEKYSELNWKDHPNKYN
jgi:hypothetical protein